MTGPDGESQATVELKKQMVAMAPVLKTVPPGTQVCFIQAGDEILLYDVNRAIELTAERAPTATVNVAEKAKQIAPRSSNPPEDKMLIDPEHARTVDLSYPVLLLEGEGGKGRIIDGWHRIYKASQLGMAELSAVVITAEEESIIRLDPGVPEG